jgi:lipoate-protein ligase A
MFTSRKLMGSAQTISRNLIDGGESLVVTIDFLTSDTFSSNIPENHQIW